MAINPFAQPINYSAQFVDLTPAFRAAGEGFRAIGEGIQEREKQEQAMNLKAQYSTDLQNALNNPTQETWSQMIAKYPQQREAFAAARKAFGETALANEFNQGFEVSTALENKRPEVAKERLQTFITARKNSNLPTGIYEDALEALERNDVLGAQANVNSALAMADPDRFQKQVEARLKASTAPSALKKLVADADAAVADAEKKVAEAKDTPARLAAEQEKRVADAALAKVRAEFALPTAKAELAKIKAETLAPSVREAIDFKNLSPADQAVFQNLQILKKPPPAVTKIDITNVDKTAAGELGKLVPDLYNQMNAAADLTGELARYRTALGTAITGPFADRRLQVAQIANAFGLVGDKGINATRELIQGNAEMSLKARSLIAGQGQGPITEGEQALLVKARAGDVNFTKGELNTLFNIFDRAAKAQYDQSRKLLQSATTQSPTAQLFLDAAKPFGAQTAPPAQPAAQVPPAQAAPAAVVPVMPAGFRVIR